MEHVAVTKSVTKYYGKKEHEYQALKSVDLQIIAGKFTILMGASGSGKSTLLHILGGLDKPTSGQVNILGQCINGLNESRLAKFRRKHIGFVFQEHNLIHQLTLEENILLAGYLVDRDKKAVRQRAKHLLEQLGIADLSKRLPGEVSGGQNQRGAIARALINEPEVVMADEPTGSLNSESSIRIMNCFRGLNLAGQSIIMVTHDIHSAAFGNEIHFLRDGAIIERLDFEEESPQSTKRENITSWLEKLSW